MSTEILVAIIGATAAVLSAIITVKTKKGKHTSNHSNNNSSTTIEGNNNIVGDNNTMYINARNDDSKIKIVDVDFVNDSEGCFIDIKIRNTGDKIAYIKKIVFNIYNSFAMNNPQITQYSLIKSTATYDVVLNGDKEQSFLLSQAVSANNVDRFKIKIASNIAETRMVTVYYFSFDIYYDEDNKIAKSEKYVAAFPSTSEWAGCFVSHTSMAIAKSNYLKLLEFSNINCKKSDIFQGIFDSYDKSKKDFM